MRYQESLASLSDEELICRLTDLLGQSRRTEADLVAHIGEVEARRLYARAAAPSMFSYCTDVLHLSEHEAYLRITVARAAREHPVLLVLLADGRLHLAGIAKLAPHLTPQNRDSLLERAIHKTKRQIEELVAEGAPRPDVPSLIRKLPERSRTAPGPGGDRVPDALRVPELPPLGPDRVPEPALQLGPDRVPSPREIRKPAATVQPLAPARYKVQFTATDALHEKLRRLQALMRSEVPDGDLAAIIEKVVTEKLERLEARRYGRTMAPPKRDSTSEPATASRYIPAAVRRAVRERDGGRCRYVDEQGRQCTERYRLEYHHRRPFGLGGDVSVGNTSLLCRAHNRYMAEQDYGRRTMSRHGTRDSAAVYAGPRGT